MNSKVLIVLCLAFIYGCSTKPKKKDSEIDSNNKNAKSSFEDTAMAGCKICLLSTKLKKIEGKRKSLENYEFKNTCELKLISKLKIEEDSLIKILNELIDEYKLDEYKSSQFCTKLYPFYYAGDTLYRDSLILEFYLWNYSRYPIIDTTCEEKKYIDNKIGVKLRGKLYMLTDDEYVTFINKSYANKFKIDSLILAKKKQILHQLTGNANPDEYCIDIMDRYSLYIFDYKYHGNPPFQLQGGYANEEFKVLFDSYRKID